MTLKKDQNWLLRHYETIGSTGAGTVAGLNPYESIPDYWDKMYLAVKKRTVLETELNQDMKRGLLTEPLHRELLAEALQTPIEDHDQDNFILNPELPWAHTLPDGWMDYQGKRVPVQLKCPRPQSWYEIRLSGIHGYWLLGSQHSMAITGAEVEYFSVLNPVSMELLHFAVERDDVIVENLMELEAGFFESIEKIDRPSEDWASMTLPDPEGGEMIRIATPEAMSAAASYRASIKLLRDAEACKEEALLRLKKMMGNSRIAQFPGVRVINIRCDGRTTIDKARMAADGLDASKYEKRGAPFSQVRVYIQKEEEIK